MTTVSVVIPAFNEEQRLPETLLSLRDICAQKQNDFNIVEVFVVNDGSTDLTEGVVLKCCEGFPVLNLISFKNNRGKGAAVHEGLRQAKGDWVLIADADMATPWTECFKLFKFTHDNALIMGSRGLPESDIEVRQHWIRQSMGKTFNFILRLLVGLPFKDTQCGFKLLKNDDFFRNNILERLQIERFSWDVELILFLDHFNKNILEVPVRWRHKEQSRVHIVRDSFEMLWSVFKIKRQMKSLK